MRYKRFISLCVVVLAVWWLKSAERTYAACSAGADYRSRQSGNWGTADTWECYNGTSWETAAAAPDNSAGTIAIQNGHTVTVAAAVTADQVTIESGGQVTVNSGVTWTIANGSGTDLSVSGTVRNFGAVSLNSGATIGFEANSLYQHDQNGGTIPTATWNSTSTASVIGWTTAGSSPGGLGQQFGNFSWNSPSQTGNPNFSGNLDTINGNFRVISTGTGQIKFTGNTALTLAIGGDMSIEGGSLDFSNGSTNGIPFVLNLSGSYSQTGGTFTFSNSGSTNVLAFNFLGSGKTFTQSGGTFTTTKMDFAVASSASLTLNNNFPVSASRSLTVNGTLNVTSGVAVTGSGNFTLASGATLGIASADGIDPGVSAGNIRVSGTRTYNSGANYVFNGSGSQNTGAGFPTTVSGLTINDGSTTTLNNNLTINGNLTVNSGGALDLSTYSMTVGGTLTNNGTLKQTKDVSGSSDIEFLNISTDKYYGIAINPGGNAMGSTTVTVSGNQTCSSPPSLGKDPIKRCYTITPTTSAAATVKLYYWAGNTSPGELNNNTASTLYIYYKQSNQWKQVNGAYTRDSDGSGHDSVQSTAVSYYGGEFTAGNHAGNLVVLASLTARQQIEGVLLAWETLSEIDNAGFNLWRSTMPEGEYIKITSALIPAKGGPTRGASYTYLDSDILPDTNYYYRLEDVDIYGVSTFWPESVVAVQTLPWDNRVFMPLLVR
jgi:hypothetical protein